MKLFNKVKFSILSASIISLITFNSCEKNNVPTFTLNPSLTLLDKATSDANFSLLAEATVKAGLVDTFGRKPAAYTLFAPDNAAFAAAGITSASIASSTPATLRSLLLYHTIQGASLFASNIATATNTRTIMANGDSAFITKKSTGVVFVNGVQVTQADQGFVNGVFHKVGRVIRPASGNIVATAISSVGVLDSLVKAINIVNSTSVASGGDPTLSATLSNSLLSVFAPSNAAFTQLLQSLSLTNINQIPVSQLTAILKYHVVTGRLFSSELANGTVTMLAGGTTTVNLTNGTSGGATIKGNGNGTNLSNIIVTDIMCRNGVAHVIDRVLLP